MSRLAGMDEKGGKAGRGEGRGDLAGDVAGFAHAAHDHAALCSQQDLDGLGKILAQLVRQLRDGARLDLQDIAAMLQHRLAVELALELPCLLWVFEHRAGRQGFIANQVGYLLFQLSSLQSMTCSSSRFSAMNVSTAAMTSGQSA